MAEPGWNADPTGRHELRYWDGTAWTDHVSDRGVTSADPVAGTPAPQQAAAPQPAPAAQPAPVPPQPVPQQPVAPQTAAPQPFVPVAAPDAAPSKLPLIIGGAVVVVIVAVAAFVLLSGGDSDNSRDVTTELAGLDVILEEAPTEDDDFVDAECPIRFRQEATDLIEDADRDVVDVESDLDGLAIFFPWEEPAIVCQLFVDFGDPEFGYVVSLYSLEIDADTDGAGLVKFYEDLGNDTDVDIEVSEPVEASGGFVYTACADDFLVPGQLAGSAVDEQPYCEHNWFSGGLIVGVGQNFSKSISEEDGQAMLLDLLPQWLDALAAEADA